MLVKPLISLHGNDESVTLSNHDTGAFILSQGATGLGWGPHELTSVGIARGGSVLRHRRLAEAEMMLPIVLASDDFYQRRDDRRQLEQLCAERVEIRVQHPDGWSRSRWGYIKDGLDGAYGAGEDSHNGQKIVLTFQCPDPWWYGAERVLPQKVGTGRKPFITSKTEPGSTARVPFFPVIVASSTVEGAYVLNIQGDAETWPIWEITGPGEDLLIEDVIHNHRIFIEGDFGETVTIDTRAGDIFSDTFTHGELWDRASLDTELFAFAPGRNRIKIVLVNAQPNSEVRLRYRETFRAGH